jgi:hypothetical protein
VRCAQKYNRFVFKKEAIYVIGFIFHQNSISISVNFKIDELVKSLILLAPQAILGFMTRLAKLQELGLTPSNSLQFLTPDSS